MKLVRGFTVGFAEVKSEEGRGKNLLPLRFLWHDLDDAMPDKFFHKRFTIECRAIYATLLHVNTSRSSHVGDVARLHVKAEK